MAQTKKKRSRKHRGSPAGTINRPPAGGKAKAKQAPKQAARERRAERMNREPSWRGSVNRAAIAAVVVGVLMIVVLKKPPRDAVGIAAAMFILYIPLGYLTDRAVYDLKQRRKQR
ncbi:MAG: hypothetical protein ACR2J6_00230 [Thermoleophilaceae bacterium]